MILPLDGAAVLRVAGVTKRFGATIALDGVDFSVAAGEVHALVGENGAGKSTLMNILSGAVHLDSGEMAIDGRPYAPTSPRAARRSGIALIHQELSLCPHLTVTENILLGAECSRLGWIDRDASRRRTQELLDNFSHPEIRPDRLVGDLPLAARQVVEICRALAADARILLMDEPTGAFQRDDTERLFAIIRRLASRGVALVYISHFLEEVREIADRYTVLRNGKSVDSGRISDASRYQLIVKMIGRSVSDHFPARARDSKGKVVLNVTGLSAPHGLEEASFELRSGEILGIFGLIGSGRSELIRALFALDAASGGRIVLDGQALGLRTATPAERLAQGFGYLSEDRKQEGLALALSVTDNLTVTRLSPFSRVFGWLNLARQRAATLRWIEVLRIRVASPDQHVGALSGGNQQKVAVGRLLHQDAALLLLDEPTRGIDVGSKERVYEVVAQCAREGKAVLMVSSYLPELFGMCDRLAVMHRGRLSPVLPVAAWTPARALAAAVGAPAAG